METAAVREKKDKRAITSFADLPGYVVKHIDADPVGTINQVLKFYGPGTIGDFNTRRHRATISMVVAVGALAKRVKVLEERINYVDSRWSTRPRAVRRRGICSSPPPSGSRARGSEASVPRDSGGQGEAQTFA
jgi:hypothetical protein